MKKIYHLIVCIFYLFLIIYLIKLPKPKQSHVLPTERDIELYNQTTYCKCDNPEINGCCIICGEDLK